MKYFLYALCFALIILKLTKLIDISWWLVLLPIYGYAIIWIIVFSAALFFNAKLASRNKPVLKTKSRFQEKLDRYMEEQRKNK